MSRDNKRKREMSKVVEGEFTPVVEQPEVVAEAPEAPEVPPAEGLFDLNDVQFMIMIGRKKDGEPFFHSVNLPDFFVADGLIGFGKRELDKAYDEFFNKRGKAE